MGQKVNPLIMRIGYIKDWHSTWFASKSDFPKFIVEDAKIRKYIKEKFRQAAVSKVVIERPSATVLKVRIFSARPGIIIGRHGADIERLREDLNALTKKEISIDIQEVRNPNIDAQLISNNIALQIEKRIAFRRAMKRAIEQAMSSGAKGIKLSCAGRLNGAEMCRTEGYRHGKVPLQTLRADIDYGFSQAITTYGLIGVKVWVYKGDIIFDKPATIEQPVVEEAQKEKE